MDHLLAVIEGLDLVLAGDVIAGVVQVVHGEGHQGVRAVLVGVGVPLGPLPVQLSGLDLIRGVVAVELGDIPVHPLFHSVAPAVVEVEFVHPRRLAVAGPLELEAVVVEVGLVPVGVFPLDGRHHSVGVSCVVE